MAVLALLGAGIFAREEHLPAIESTEGAILGAIYSRSKASAEALASESTGSPDVYFDNPVVTGRSLDDLLARGDITGVVVCLPIVVQPSIIEKALAAGKHVLSEKPIAKDVATARSLISHYDKIVKAPQWAVGENLRFSPAIQHGTDAIKAIGGDVVTFSLKMYTFVDDQNKYFNTEWRKVPEYQGGFLLDGGVHFVASLRYLLSATAEDIQHVAAATTLLQPKLAPVDTVHAILATTRGSIGTFSVSFGTEFKSAFEIEVVTTKGSVVITPTEAITRSHRDDKTVKEDKKTFVSTFGVKAEIASFVNGLQTGQVDPRQTPAEALRDLIILQTMLESTAQGTTNIDTLK